MTYNPKRLGRYLRVARERERLTQEQLAARSGITNKKISRIENGLVDDPGFADIVLLGNALAISIDVLVAAASLLEDK